MVFKRVRADRGYLKKYRRYFESRYRFAQMFFCRADTEENGVSLRPR